MRFTVRIILLSYRCLYLVYLLSPYFLLAFLVGGDIVYLLFVNWDGGGFNAPSQVAGYLVVGVLTGFGWWD